jgi:hypothetical protein
MGVFVVPLLLGVAVGLVARRVNTCLWWGVRCDYCLAIVWLLSELAKA